MWLDYAGPISFRKFPSRLQAKVGQVRHTWERLVAELAAVWPPRNREVEANSDAGATPREARGRIQTD